MATLFLALSPRLGRRTNEARRWCGEAEWELFRLMRRYDRAHSLRVADGAGGDRTLQAAALLHDVGKSHPCLKMRHRWMYTLLELAVPGMLRKLEEKVEEEARGEEPEERLKALNSSWKKAFYVQAHHGELGASMLKRIGVDEEVIALVAAHQHEPEGGGRVRRLWELDGDA